MLSLLAHAVSAQTMYIDDILLVPLRSGETLSHRIVHKGLPSGTKLTVLENNRETGYSKVLTPGGIEGYLPTRYLVSEPIARDKLEAANKEFTATKQQLTNLKQQFETLSSEHNALKKSYQQTEQSLDKNVQELSHIRSVSANALTLDQRNRELRESNEQLRNEMELLQTDNNRLNEKSESKMMMIGGALVLLGVILALLIPMLKPSKKNDGWS